MKLLVIGAGMMGSAAAYDMARSKNVESVTLADMDHGRAKAAVQRIRKMTGTKNILAAQVDASRPGEAAKLIREAILLFGA